MEKKFELRTVIVKHFCEPCAKVGGGEYLPTGRVLLSNPPQYPHECNNCGEEKIFEKSYPTLEYVEVNDEV